MTTQRNYAVPTGDFIDEWLERHGVTAAELSRRLGVSRKHVSLLLAGKAPLSHELAQALERVTQVPARIWNQYEALYREDLARLGADRTLADQYTRAREFPLAYLRKQGAITAPSTDRAGTVRELLTFFGVAHLDALHETWHHGAVAYRKAAARRDDAKALATWLTAGERGIDVATLAPYDATRLRTAVPELRSLTRHDPTTYLLEATQTLAAAGVALVFVPPVPGLGIYGATRWVGGHPVIQLSLRGKTDDQLWFTLFHEIGHVLLHPPQGLYLTDNDDAAEAEANTFAADTLVPPAHAPRLPTGRNVAAVRALAEEIGVSPGVVLGQAQHRSKDFAWGHGLKVTFDFTHEHGSPTHRTVRRDAV